MLILLLSIFLNFSTIPSINIESDVMYVEMENKIQIQLNGSDPSDIQLKVNLGTLRQLDDSTYIYLPQMTDEEIKLKLYHKRIVCDIKVIFVKNLPDPIIKFEKEVNGQIKRSDLPQLGKLFIDYGSEFPQNIVPPIYQYSLIISDTQGKFLLSSNVSGEELDQKTLNDIQKLKNIGKISINNVLVKSNNAVKRINVNKTIDVLD